MRELLDISIYTEEIKEVVGKNKIVKMIPFTGICESSYFKGEVMPGAMDVQVLEKNGQGILSARYMLEGIDYLSMPCKIFIDNTGTIGRNGCIETIPKIVTDSKALEWMQIEEVHCQFVTEDGVFHVKMYLEEEAV